MASNVYGGPDPAAAGKVATPALVIQILAGLTVFFCLANLAWNLLVQMGMAHSMGDARFSGVMGGVVGILSALLGILLYGFVIFAAQKMKNLESYALAMVAVIAMMLPCFPCCCLNLFVGIWGLVALLDANVKAAFRG